LAGFGPLPLVKHRPSGLLFRCYGSIMRVPTVDVATATMCDRESMRA
jgi:hypothetical protein